MYYKDQISDVCPGCGAITTMGQYCRCQPKGSPCYTTHFACDCQIKQMRELEEENEKYRLGMQENCALRKKLARAEKVVEAVRLWSNIEDPDKMAVYQEQMVEALADYDKVS